MKKVTNKDPAFLFYSADFLIECADLLMEERGQYITIYCLQHQHGHLSRKTIDLNIPNISADVLNKLSTDKDGKYYNKKLEIAIQNRKEYSRKQREKALKRWEKVDKQQNMPRHSNGTSQASAETMPIVNVNEIVVEDKNTNENDIYNYVEENYGRPLTSVEISGIALWKETFSDDMIKYAIDISVMQSVKKFAYVNGILNNWKSQGYEALEQVKFEEQRFKTKEAKQTLELYDYDWLSDTDILDKDC